MPKLLSLLLLLLGVIGYVNKSLGQSSNNQDSENRITWLRAYFPPVTIPYGPDAGTGFYDRITDRWDIRSKPAISPVKRDTTMKLSFIPLPNKTDEHSEKRQSLNFVQSLMRSFPRKADKTAATVSKI